LIESSQRRVTRTGESLRLIGFKDRVNVESHEISHLLWLLYPTKWRPSCYQMALNMLSNAAL